MAWDRRPSVKGKFGLRQVPVGVSIRLNTSNMRLATSCMNWHVSCGFFLEALLIW